jgi:hypothetical protein
MLQTLSKVDPELAVTDAMHADHPPSLVSEHRTPMRVTADLRQPSVPGNFDRLMDRSSTVGISESSCVWHRRLAASQRGGREALERSLRGRIAAGAVGHVRWPTAGDYQRLHPPTPALQRRAVVIAPASALRSASVRGCSYCRELLQVPPVRCTSRCTDCRQAGRTSCFRRAEIAQAQPPGRGFPRHDRSAAITTGAVRCTATTLRMTATVRRTANVDCVLLRRPGWQRSSGHLFHVVWVEDRFEAALAEGLEDLVDGVVEPLEDGVVLVAFDAGFDHRALGWAVQPAGPQLGHGDAGVVRLVGRPGQSATRVPTPTGVPSRIASAAARARRSRTSATIERY